MKLLWEQIGESNKFFQGQNEIGRGKEELNRQLWHLGNG
jgi:hypothetical protein